MMMMVMRGLRGRVRVERGRRHEREDEMERGAPEDGQAVDVTEVDFSGLRGSSTMLESCSVLTWRYSDAKQGATRGDEG